jgi:hypothetical protein
MIAKDLYRLQQEVESLEERLKSAPHEEKAEIKDMLRKTKTEHNRMRRILDGSKEPSPYRKPR